MHKKRDRREKYPLAAMSVGQSCKYTGATRTGPYVVASRANKRLKPKLFYGGYDKGGIGRIWRQA